MEDNWVWEILRRNFKEEQKEEFIEMSLRVPLPRNYLSGVEPVAGGDATRWRTRRITALTWL